MSESPKRTKPYVGWTPSVEFLRSILSLDERTGTLTWLFRPPSPISGETSTERVGRLSFNKRLAGKPAFNANSHGYLAGTLNRVTYSAHRIIWKMAMGYDAKIIDHVNGDKKDNRLSNLRDATHAENISNSKARNKRSNLPIGVARTTGSSSFSAYITLNGKRKHLGSFSDINDASAARLLAEINSGRHFQPRDTPPFLPPKT